MQVKLISIISHNINCLAFRFPYKKRLGYFKSLFHGALNGSCRNERSPQFDHKDSAHRLIMNILLDIMTLKFLGQYQNSIK
ncbi:hypothetical protein TorRG33x02_034630 [Trema orientale]|uniref:Uncharacterized protein n=1 Tax=Trema orientale TaxID=63057 RepID=A0A2P5FSU0_TREOI|nr:hypothetical protein TorRG33x02_034630 [Trema orientale]